MAFEVGYQQIEYYHSNIITLIFISELSLESDFQYDMIMGPTTHVPQLWTPSRTIGSMDTQ